MSDKKASEHAACYIAPDNDGYHEFLIYFTPRSHSMEYIVLEVSGWAVNQTTWKNTHPLFDNNGAVEDPDLATPLVQGHVKWDGCADLDIGGDENSYRNHFCGLDSALILERVVRAIYMLAEQHIPQFDKEIAA